MPTDPFADWRPLRPRTKAIICDIDDTLCSQFDCPIDIACTLLRQLDPVVVVHYVTARPEASRDGTEKFILDHKLPGWRNLHFCPSHVSSRQHKIEVMTRLAREYDVRVSIGDHDEDEHASTQAGVPFVRVGDVCLITAWRQVAVFVGLGENSS